MTVYVRKRYFTRNLNLAIKSEFERTKTRDFLRRRTLSIQKPAGHVADARRPHDSSSSYPVITRVDTNPRPISSADFGGMLLQRASSHASTAMHLDERNDRHDMLHESPITSAVSVHQTRAEQNLYPR